MKMEFKKYMEEEFNKWCEDNTIEDNFGLWDFIKDQKVILELTDEKESDTHLTIKVELSEV